MRLLAGIADDRRSEIRLCWARVGAAYPALTPACPAVHAFEREILSNTASNRKAIPG
jgi:hypothetical protein